jgi:heme O synthase-like polyprenyltransferase
MVGVLSVVTLTIYNFYLVYRWAQELNAISGRQRHNPVVVLVISIVTLGIGISVFECFFARDLEAQLEEAQLRPVMHGYATVVIALNVAAIVLTLSVYGSALGYALGVAATILLQLGFNRLAHR